MVLPKNFIEECSDCNGQGSFIADNVQVECCHCNSSGHRCNKDNKILELIKHNCSIDDQALDFNAQVVELTERVKIAERLIATLPRWELTAPDGLWDRLKVWSCRNQVDLDKIRENFRLRRL